MQQLQDGVVDSRASNLVRNNIADKRRQRNFTAKDLADQLPGMTPPIYSNIETGRVMPTKASLRTICAVLRCAPTDLYQADQLNLAEDSTPSASKADASPASNDRGHPGQVEFRSWLRPAERQTLRDVVMALGYRSEAEWFREMRRNTIARARRLGLMEEVHPAKTIITPDGGAQHGGVHLS